MCLFACFVFVLILFVWCFYVCVCVGGGIVVVSGGRVVENKIECQHSEEEIIIDRMHVGHNKTICTAYLFAILDPCHAHTDKCFLLCFHKNQLVCHRLKKGISVKHLHVVFLCPSKSILSL